LSEVKEFGAAGFTFFPDGDFGDVGAVGGPDFFDADTVSGNSSDGEGLVDSPTLDGNDNAFKSLSLGFFTHFEFMVNSDGVADIKAGVFDGCLEGHDERILP